MLVKECELSKEDLKSLIKKYNEEYSMLTTKTNILVRAIDKTIAVGKFTLI